MSIYTTNIIPKWKQEQERIQKAYIEGIQDGFVNSFGQKVPAVIEVEEIILGTLLLEKEAFELIDFILPIEAFYNKRNREVYKAILELYKDSKKTVDIITVSNLLNNRFLEGNYSYYVVKLTERVASATHIMFHTRILMDTYFKRKSLEIMHLSSKAILEEGTGGNDIIDTLRAHLKTIEELIDFVPDTKTSLTSKELVKNYLNIVHELPNLMNEQGIVRLDNAFSGFSDLDNYIGSIGNGLLFGIAARPSVGKTAVMFSFMVKKLLRAKEENSNYAAAFFSIEQGLKACSQRVGNVLFAYNEILMNNIGVDTIKGYNALTPEQVNQLDIEYNKLADLSYKLDCETFLTPSSLRYKIHRLKKEFLIDGKKLKDIFIDYFQILKPDTSTGNQLYDYNQTIEALKSIAKQENINIYLGTQINDREGKNMPHLGNMKGTAALEEACDIIIALHDYYKTGTEEIEGETTFGKLYFRVLKNKDGKCDGKDIDFLFEKRLTAIFQEKIIEEDIFKGYTSKNNISNYNKDIFDKTSAF